MKSAERAKERLIEEGNRARKDAELMAIGQQIAEEVMLEAKVEKQAEEISRLTDELTAKEAALEVLIKDFTKVNNEIVTLQCRNDNQSDTILELKTQLAKAGK